MSPTRVAMRRDNDQIHVHLLRSLHDFVGRDPSANLPVEPFDFFISHGGNQRPQFFSGRDDVALDKGWGLWDRREACHRLRLQNVKKSQLSTELFRETNRILEGLF